MARFVKVALKSELGTGQRKVVDAGDECIALFNIDGNIYAIENICCHRGGPLADGPLEGTVVKCPWHGWTFDVTTGKSPILSGAEVKSFEVKIEGDDLLVGI